MSSRSQTFTTIALVAVAAGLAGYLWLDRGKPTTSELEARKNKLLTVFRREELSEIHLQVGAQKARITRLAGAEGGISDYRIALDGLSDAEPAEAVAVDRLLQALEFASAVRKLESGVSRSSLGLDSPRAIVVLHQGKNQTKIELGAPTPSPAGASYAFVENVGFVVVTKDLVLEALRPIDSYRSRTIVPHVASDLSRIQIESAGISNKLVRGTWGGFRVESSAGQGPRVNHATYDQILEALAALRVERFPDPKSAEETLSAAKRAGKYVSLTLEPTDKSKAVVRLELGGDCPAAVQPPLPGAESPDSGPSEARPLTVVLVREPQRLAACVPAAALDNLRVTREQLADRRLLDLKPDAIEELRLQQGDQVLELARKGTGWKLRKPEERDVSVDDAKGLIEGLTKLEGEIVSDADVKAAGLEPPKGTLLVIQPASGKQEHPQQKIELGDSQGDSVLVRRECDGIVLRLSRNQARLLAVGTTYLRPTALLDIPPEHLKRIAVTWGKSDKQVVVRSPSGFKLEVPTGFFADGTLAADLFDAVAKLKAERWVAERDDGSFGLAQPQLSAQLDFTEDGGNKTERLLIGARQGDAVYGKWEQSPGVFLLSRSVETTLSSYAIDRSLFLLDPAETQSLTLFAGGKKYVLTSTEGKWQSAEGGAKLTESSVERIREAFLQMRVEGVVHLGEAQEAEGLAKPLLEVLVKRVPGHEERSKDIHLSIGRGDVWRTMNIYYARREGVPATFALAASRLKPVLTAVGE